MSSPLSTLAKTVGVVDDDFEDERDLPPPSDLAKVPPADLCGDAILKRALPRALRARFENGSPLAIILRAPAPEWCDVLADAVERWRGSVRHIEYSGQGSDGIYRNSRTYVFTRSEPDSRGRADRSGEDIPLLLGDGLQVIGIASDLSILPAQMRDAADAIIDCPPLRGRDVMKIVRMTTGAKRVENIPDEVAQRLTPNQVATAVRRGSSGADSIHRLWTIADRGTTGAYVDDPEVPTLDEVSGYGEARAWGLALKLDIDRRLSNAASVPIEMLTRSLLLAGAPGTGKTFFARVLAKSCRIPLLMTSYLEWQSAGGGYLSDVMKAMNEAFAKARSAAISGSGCGAILLVDEIDSIPSREAGGRNNNSGWWTSLQNALLTLVEQNSPARQGVILIACSNYPDRLDAALRRSGRLDHQITLAASMTPEDTVATLRWHLFGDLIDEDLMPLAMLARGLTPADIARVVRDARQAARNETRELRLEDVSALLAPIETRPARIVRSYALHEAGHAVIGVQLGIGDLRFLSLHVPDRPEAGAIASYDRRTDLLLTRAALENLVMTKLAGRATDELFGEAHSGAGGGEGSDLADATAIVASLHISYCLGGTLTTTSGADDALERIKTDPALRALVEQDLQALYARTQALVAESRNAIAAVARALISKRLLVGEEVRAVIASLGAQGDVR